MKAHVLKKYGSPEVVLTQEELPVPEPKKNEVLVRIKATAINDYDWAMVTGKPYLYRLLFGIFSPRQKVPGMELSGTVEQVGNDVLGLKEGDDVYGDISDFGFGTFSEFICIDENALRLKPEALSFEQAAALPHAGGLAYQSLVEKAGLKEGQKILINGAGGGVGTIGLQVAKKLNCHVTGVDTGGKLEKMVALGFDEVIDYKDVDFTRLTERWDIILDAKTNRPVKRYFDVLTSGGMYVTVGGDLGKLLSVFIHQTFFSKKADKQACVLALKENGNLEELERLYLDGDLVPVIDGSYSHEDAAKFVQYFGEGKHFGKLILR